jgi:hypothetical protein
MAGKPGRDGQSVVECSTGGESGGKPHERATADAEREPHVTRHTSHVTHTPHVTRHLLPLTLEYVPSSSTLSTDTPLPTFTTRQGKSIAWYVV